MLTRESPHNSGIFCPGFWLLCHSPTRREPRDTNLPRDFHRKFLARQARYPPEGIRSRRFSAAHQAESERRERRRRREDRRVLRDADRRWIPSLRRDRETFYESFYERLYEPRTELGPRLRFCYTRAATAMSLSPPPPPRNPAGPAARRSSSPLFIFPSSQHRDAFSLSILESTSFFIIIVSRRRYSRRLSRPSRLYALSLSPSPSPSLSSAAFFVIRASHARISCFPENSSLATTATKEEGGRRGGKRTKGESSEIDRFSSKEARRFSTSSARTEPRAVRRVDVRFRVNWISSAFLFSN